MPCNPSPCGANAVCKERNGVGACTCLPEYSGDPYTECRPECVLNTDCPKNLACMNNKCRDPCPGVCGVSAECHVINHAPSCSCPSGYTGNPSEYCREQPKRTVFSFTLYTKINFLVTFCNFPQTSNPYNLAVLRHVVLIANVVK